MGQHSFLELAEVAGEGLGECLADALAAPAQLGAGLAAEAQEGAGDGAGLEDRARDLVFRGRRRGQRAVLLAELSRGDRRGRGCRRRACGGGRPAGSRSSSRGVAGPRLSAGRMTRTRGRWSPCSEGSGAVTRFVTQRTSSFATAVSLENSIFGLSRAQGRAGWALAELSLRPLLPGGKFTVRMTGLARAFNQGASSLADRRKDFRTALSLAWSSGEPDTGRHDTRSNTMFRP